MAWKSVPCFFPDPDDISPEDWYHLREGYGVYGFETKYKGGHFKKIKVDGSFVNLMYYLGYTSWSSEWVPVYGFWKQLWYGKWRRK